MNKKSLFFGIFVCITLILDRTEAAQSAGTIKEPLLTILYSGGLGGNISSCG